MRGKGKPVLSGCRRVGITPAYAGKSVELTMHWQDVLGSPPPMRGKG